VTVSAEVLLQPATLELIDSLSAQATEADIVTTVSRLKKAGHDSETIHQALEQVRLRRKARAKFGHYADQMLFTESGLEQATRLPVAAFHAGRFRDAQMTSVADLGCGIGADSLAFAALGLTVHAIDSDPTVAALASYNLALFETATVQVGDALGFHHGEVDSLWLDPARRSNAQRVGDPQQWSPPLDEAFRLARTKPTGIKLAPGMDRELIPDDAEAQWVSHGGDVVEMVLWWGPLARPGVKRAALVLGDDSAREITGGADALDEPVRSLGEYLFEPDGAVIRARLIGDLARELGGGMVSTDIAYITTDTAQHTALAQGFRIREVLSAKPKDLARWVRTEDIGVLEIKKRGVDIDPAKLRAQLNPRGEQPATLIITRVEGKRVALVAERLD